MAGQKVREHVVQASAIHHSSSDGRTVQGVKGVPSIDTDEGVVRVLVGMDALGMDEHF
jgi:hypothetical protein